MYALRSYFGCGSVVLDNKNSNTYKFQVTNLRDIRGIIIPHFMEYPLVGSKQLDFLSWYDAIYSNNDLTKILILKNNMNSKRSFEERWNYLNNKNIILEAEWVQAFIDGEGSFQCNISNTTNRGKPIVNINFTLEIAQNNHEIKVLDSIRSFFNKGYLKPKYDFTSLENTLKARSVSRYVVYGDDVIIDFFSKYPMNTLKQLDFLDWKETIGLKKDNVHKSIEGLEKMLAIKRGMNKSRNINNDIIKRSDNKLEFIQWSLLSNNIINTSHFVSVDC